MNTKLLRGVVTLFAELTPSMSNTERMDLFKSMLPKEAAPIPPAAPAAPIQVNPSAAFIVNGEKGQKVSLPEAIAYWKRHNP